MAFIKSALELAMEKSADIKVDKAELRHKEVFNAGRAFAAKMLSEGPEFTARELKPQRKTYKGAEEKTFLEGVAETLVSRLVLTVVDPKREIGGLVPHAEQVFGAQGAQLFAQAAEFLLQYADEIVQLRETIVQQVGPQLRQRAQQIAQQTGNTAKYVMEKDPQYLKILSQNLEPLRTHYTQGLEAIKTQLRALL